MAPVLWCLLLLLLLPYLLAAGGGYYKTRFLGGIDNHHPRVQDSQLTGVANRLWASQRNAWEALPFFIGCVLLAHLRGVDLVEMTNPAVLYTVTRLAHPVLYIGDMPTARSLTVALGMFTGLYLAVGVG